MLESGMERVEEFVVEDYLLTDVGGSLRTKVLSTPGMIGKMEGTAARLSATGLPAGKATVGFEVCVKHVAGATEGSRCKVVARLRDITDERKLFFDVEVREGDRTIGVGTHERRVIDAEQHARSL
jgi:predicted thioesterase